MEGKKKMIMARHGGAGLKSQCSEAEKGGS
jgi:hypothetical protein